MGPCKKCIVRACCTQDCDDKKRFIKTASEVSTFLSFMIAVFITAPIIFYFMEFYSDKEHGRTIVNTIWLTSTVISAIISKVTIKDSSIVFSFLFGPFATLTFTFLYISSKIVKRV